MIASRQILATECGEIELRAGGVCRAKLNGEKHWYQLNAGQGGVILCAGKFCRSKLDGEE